MKKKLLFTLVIIGLLSILFINLQSNICIAGNGNYSISIEENKANYVKEVTKGGSTTVSYDVIIRLYNSGPDASDKMTIILSEQGWGINLTSDEEIIIGPGEYKTYVFEDYPVSPGVQSLQIQYYPTEIDYRNSANTGEASVSLSGPKKDEESSTPGFEIFLLIIAAFIIIYFKKEIYKP